jgi:hypothetical protein
MSRGAVARQRQSDSEAWRAESFRVTCERDELRERGEHLDTENARLCEQLDEVEGWYRLLQKDHAALQDEATRAGKRVTELQSETNRLAAENQALQAFASGSSTRGRTNDLRERPFMFRIRDFVRVLRRYKWAAAATLTVATLLARDAGVQELVGSAVERTRNAFRDSKGAAHSGADSGYIRYAAMVNSREQAERARREYNESEGKLKGDALLEAQDRLRAAKARFLEARLAFLPELARECGRANVALPAEASDALASLKAELPR